MLHWLRVRKANRILTELVQDQATLIANLQAKLSDPTEYLKYIMARGVSWFDHSKIDKGLQQSYYADAQNIVNGEVFNNELDHFIADLVKFNANESRDFDAVMNVRASIVALETFKKRLASIENPNKLPVDFDPQAEL